MICAHGPRTVPYRPIEQKIPNTRFQVIVDRRQVINNPGKCGGNDTESTVFSPNLLYVIVLQHFILFAEGCCRSQAGDLVVFDSLLLLFYPHSYPQPPVVNSLPPNGIAKHSHSTSSGSSATVLCFSNTGTKTIAGAIPGMNRRSACETNRQPHRKILIPGQPWPGQTPRHSRIAGTGSSTRPSCVPRHTSNSVCAGCNGS